MKPLIILLIGALAALPGAPAPAQEQPRGEQSEARREALRESTLDGARQE